MAKVKKMSKKAKRNAVNGLSCPDCKSKMIVKEGKFGVFAGCIMFPKCYGARTVKKPKEVVAEQYKPVAMLGIKNDQLAGQEFRVVLSAGEIAESQGKKKEITDRIAIVPVKPKFTDYFSRKHKGVLLIKEHPVQ